MDSWDSKYIIGLTGNIAVGKSVVRQMLQHLGAYTIDADSLAHEVLLPGAPAYEPVIEEFGKFILNDDGSINRGRLGQIVFANDDALRKLEELTHPPIREAIHYLVDNATKNVVVIEAIKLLESTWRDACDAIWVVNADLDTQLTRLMQTRGLSESEATKRIFAQSAQKVKLNQADVIIDNSRDVKSTWLQVMKHWDEIQDNLQAS